MKKSNVSKKNEVKAVKTVKVSGPAEIEDGWFSPLQVKVTNNFDRAFKIFKTMVQADGILALFKEKQSFEKPSDKKRREKNENIKNVFDAELKQKKILSGEYEKEKLKKQAKKERKMKERERDNKGNV